MDLFPNECREMKYPAVCFGANSPEAAADRALMRV